MTALVTGATGLLGANLVRELLRTGEHVRVLVRRESDQRALAGLDVDRHVGDVLDITSLTEAARGVDVLYHLASTFSYWGHRSEAIHRVAVDGARCVIEAARRSGLGRVVLTSSSITVGSSTTTVPRDETSHAQYRGAPDYYRAKIEQEAEALDAAERGGVDLVIAAPAIVVGPHDYRLSPSNGIIVAYLDDPIGVTWPGGINVVHAADVARGHILLAARGKRGERYLLGGENWEWSLVHRTIAELAGLPPPRVNATHTSAFLAASVMEGWSLLTGRPPSSTRAQAMQVGQFFWYRSDRAAAIGFTARPARQALAETIAWMLVRGPYLSKATRLRLSPSPEVQRAREAFLESRRPHE